MYRRAPHALLVADGGTAGVMKNGPFGAARLGRIGGVREFARVYHKHIPG